MTVRHIVVLFGSPRQLTLATFVNDPLAGAVTGR